MADTFAFNDEPPQPEPGNEGPESPTPESPEGNNRNFLIIAIVLGGIVLLSLVCMAAYALWILPRQRAGAQATSAANAAAGTATSMIEAQTQLAASFTATPAPSDTPVPLPTETLVVAFSSPSPSAAPSVDPVTATVQALQTQLAFSQATSGTQIKTTGTPGTPGTQTLARTGFADEVGLPGLFIAAILLIAIILLARRLRQAPQSR